MRVTDGLEALTQGQLAPDTETHASGTTDAQSHEEASFVRIAQGIDLRLTQPRQSCSFTGKVLTAVLNPYPETALHPRVCKCVAITNAAISRTRVITPLSQRLPAAQTL